MSDKRDNFVDKALKQGEDWIKVPENQQKVKGWIEKIWDWVTRKK